MFEEFEVDVSIILVNYKTRDLTINAIKSVYEKTLDLEFEIFVVDNNSQDGSIEAIEKEFPNINVIKNPINAGFGVANNIAIKQAKGKYILCLNTDTLLINNAIKIMFDFMEKNENQNVATCGGQLYDAENNPAFSYGRFYNLYTQTSLSWLLKFLYNKFFYKSKFNELKENKEVQFVCGADLFIRKNILDKVGCFDEKFFMYCEEMDLCYNFHKLGYKSYIVPSAKIIHLEGKSTSSFWKNTEMRVKSKYIYARKNQSKFDVFIIKASYIIMHLIAYLFSFNKVHIDRIKLHIFC